VTASKRRRLWIAAAVLGVLLAAIIALSIVAWLGAGRAQRDGTASLPILSAPVTVRWDERAVPYVDAANVHDLAATLGWLHANDRFTQMELGRRFAAGRLSELVGEAALAVDRENRTLRLARFAEAQWESSGAESRAWLEAYAAGVNAWLTERGGDLPPDLRLLAGTGFRPEPWQPRDSLCFALLMAQDLSFWNGRPEEARFRWLRAFGAERTAELIGGSPYLAPEIAALAAAGAAEGATGGALAGTGEAAPEAALGSNNWALGPDLTDDGAPLVANDPHLPFRLPGTWYLARLHAPGYDVAGATLPGLPGVVIGRGRDLAWALTNVMLDDHDLFFEDLRPGADGGPPEVRRGEAWVPVRVEHESIAVKGGESVSLDLYFTDRGLLLPAEPASGPHGGGLPERSLAWTLAYPGDPLAAFLTLARFAGGETVTVQAAPAAAGSEPAEPDLASSTADQPMPAPSALAPLLAALEGFLGPAQNLVLAYRDGEIAWTVLGRVPQRRLGDGWLPSPAWDPRYGWDGLRPRIDNPTVIVPPGAETRADLLVTANNRVLPADYPLPMTADYDGPFRAERIRQLLASGAGRSPGATSSVQTDVVDLYALRVVATALDGLDDFGGDAGRARDLLAAWDGRMADRAAGGGPNPAAPLFAFFERALRRGIFGDEAAAAGLRPFDSRDRLDRALAGDMSAAWFDDVSTPRVEDRAAVVVPALAAAWGSAVQRWGSDPDAWSYGDLHTLTLHHPAGVVPVVGRLFNRGPFPVPGSATTVAAFGARWSNDGTGGPPVQRVSNGPSLRWVTDLAHPDDTLVVLPSGQAGHPRDPCYDDQTPLYLAGELRPLPWSDAAIEAATVSRLTLQPRPAAAPEPDPR